MTATTIILYFVYGFSILILGVSSKACTDGCDRPQFCADGDFAADPNDCTQYYQCVFSEWITQPCASTLYFDKSSCVCTSYNSSCLTCPSTTPRTTLPPAPCPNIPDPCEEGKKYPDQSDCTAYYLCSAGVLGSRTTCNYENDPVNCPVGLACAFDIILSECVVPDASFDCDTRCPEITTLPSETTTLPQETTSAAPGCAIDACDRPPTCGGDELTGDPGNCTAYYRCSFDVWLHGACAAGMAFDNRSCECVQQENAVCQQCTERTTTPDYPLECYADPCDKPTTCRDLEITPDPYNCQNYYFCNFGLWQSLTCPGDMYFDSSTCECTVQDVATCPECENCASDGCARSVNCTDGEIAGEPDLCDIYYVCEHGEWAIKSCNDGHQFNVRNCRCVAEGTGQCLTCPDVGNNQNKHHETPHRNNISVSSSAIIAGSISTVVLLTVLFTIAIRRKSKIRNMNARLTGNIEMIQ